MRNPRVSIGIPVYNGAKYIEDAIESILAQTYEDFELLISDNASTDKTEEICRKYAARYPQIKYVRNAENLGAARNFNRVFGMASGAYFKWAAHDDVIAPSYLAECVEILENDPGVVLCYPHTRIINAEGKEVGRKDRFLRIGATAPSTRLHDLLCVGGHAGYPVFGLVRKEVLEKTNLIESFVASDFVLLAKLSLLGRFQEIPKFLFSARDHVDRSIRAQPMHKRSGWFDTRKQGKISFPRWRLLAEYYATIGTTDLPRGERVRCLLVLAKWSAKRWKQLLVKDSLRAVETLLKRVYFKLSSSHSSTEVGEESELSYLGKGH